MIGSNLNAESDQASMALPAQDALWYKDAMIYQVHVGTDFDGDGDGIGDIRRATQRLDYLQELGITTL